MNSLTKFVKDITTTYHKDLVNDRRLAAASAIAEKYNISPPTIVLMFTVPEFKLLPIEDRCKRAGVTEEELFLCSTQPGFKEFLEAYEGLVRGNLTIQSLEKLSEAVKDNRTVPSQFGDRDDFTVETKIIEKAPQVNVNNNTQMNFYDRARQKVLESKE